MTHMRKRCAEGWDGPASPYLAGHGRDHVCARPPGHPPPCMCYCGERRPEADRRPATTPLPRRPKARYTSQLDCGHWARPGQRIHQRDGQWVCQPCAIAAINRKDTTMNSTTTLRCDPVYDQCGAPPFHGTKRAGIMWYGEPAFLCPQCFESLFCVPPPPGQMVKVPA
jgi:hypothetical protein